MDITTILILGAIAFLFMLGLAALIAKFYRKVEQGKALIVNTMRAEPTVTFTGATVYPIVHKAEVMDISVKTIEIDRRGKEGLICKDNIRADIKVTFFVRVNKTREDVLKVAQAIGCSRASDQETLEELFIAKFSEALKTVGKRLEFEELYKERDNFKDQIIEIIGKDLNGYGLEDAAIDYLEQTPLESLDPQNILDAQGIKKITNITTQQNVLTNDLKQVERKAIKKQDVEADEAVFELDRQRSDALAKQQREIATVQAREQAETLKVSAEEKARAAKARIKAEEELEVEAQNKMRQVEVAEKNRQRVVAIEEERVKKDRDLEAISRERETDLQRISKEKAIEQEKKAIADVVRERVAVDKTVAEEEEKIKDTHALAEARRLKEVTKLTAEGEALEALVKTVKAAEAQEQVATHRAKEKLTLAQADLEASDKQAQAKIRLAEGVQAEEAASGLAEAKVKEADALATEKQGMAKVRVHEAEAGAIEKQGMAKVKVDEATAGAIQKQGSAEAEVERLKLLAEAEGTKEKALAEAAGEKEKLLAEAAGAREKGMALVHVKDAEAEVVEKRGLAEAVAIKGKLTAEATGLEEKAKAMKALDGVGREHEEFRLELDKKKEVELEGIRVRQSIAEAQAEVLASAFTAAKFNIVGGDGAFFQNFLKAVTLGQSIDASLDHGNTLSALSEDYMTGEKSLTDDIKQVLSRPALDAAGVQNLTVSAILGRLMLSADNDGKSKIRELLDKARDLGIDQIKGG